MRPSLIVHGGAWAIPEQSFPACRDGIRHSLDAGWKVLSRGGSAADAVETAIVSLEDDPVFDAGFGSHLTLDGRVQLDAILMDGATLKAGAVAAVERVRNPIRLARCILEKSKHILLVGAGAEQFAHENGIALCDPDELITEQERAAWLRCRQDSHAAENHSSHSQGTVGAVALDSLGGLFAGTSTGGTCCKHSGRVGDSPLIGCGCYADSEWGGVSCTGNGEGIMKIVMAKMAVDLLAEPPGDPYQLRPKPEGSQPQQNQAQFVADACVRKLAHRARATGGLILLDREGIPAAAFNTPYMAYGFVAPDGRFHIFP
ncbi:MAG TPA: isoaspartyl peptidase/L-asparaginase [Candidatus Acidoferrales bacterium]|nr:isoaspartyl peptidase/L-asparaginase [Candidatus Acidoferrales bacterium]